MKVLVTGRGTSGSWQIRGVQLGNAIGAHVKSNADAGDIINCDIAVVVKRTPEATLEALRASGKPWVLDMVDGWPQPLACRWTRSWAISWVREMLAELKPNAVIWPTRKMMEDCGEGYEGICIPHHYRPGIRHNIIRHEVKTVGYEGREAYLGEWTA